MATSATDNPHKFSPCSAAGICDHSTGECDCFESFEGAACERSVCPNQCSGHGRCRFIEEIAQDYSSVAWDVSKIQGCVCDAGWSGKDCSVRMCPKGDDPLTVPADPSGQEWELTFHLDPEKEFESAEFHLEIEDLFGETHLTRPIALDASADDIAQALTFTSAIRELEGDVIPTDMSVANDTAEITFTLMDPLRLHDIRVKWEDDCTVAGCQPLRKAMAPEGFVLGASAEITVDAEDAAESAECSNRGMCDKSTGICQCFEGFFGIACEGQTVLV